MARPTAGPKQPAKSAREGERGAAADRADGGDRRKTRRFECAKIRRYECGREAGYARECLDGERAVQRNRRSRWLAE